MSYLIMSLCHYVVYGRLRCVINGFIFTFDNIFNSQSNISANWHTMLFCITLRKAQAETGNNIKVVVSLKQLKTGSCCHLAVMICSVATK